jgi:ketosteroid isomerase-like protein
MNRDIDHQQLLRSFGDIIQRRELDRLSEVFHADAVLYYPQSGERFRGQANIRAQFESYPDMNPETSESELQEVIGGTTYVLTPSYTVVGVDGSGDRGVAIIRVRYPDQSIWYAVNIYELRDGRIARSRAYFAPVFEAPDWRAPFREAIGG